jgi:hypothetical protein
MPAAPVRQLSRWRWPILASLLAGLGYFMYCEPKVILFFVALGVMCWISIIFDAHHKRRLMAARDGETICEFVRSFDRNTDTWILRAVYEEVSRYLSVDGRPLPVRRGDRCEKDLKIDLEDLNDIASDVAFRAQRSLNDAEKNPLYNKVETVGDVVTFFEHQPKVVNVESGERPIR